MSQNKILDSVKTILDINDDKSDELLKIYVNNANDFILDYTRLPKIPATLGSTVIDMAVFQYRQRELENVKSESMGAMGYSFITEYPSNITDRLDSYKRALFL